MLRRFFSSQVAGPLLPLSTFWLVPSVALAQDNSASSFSWSALFSFFTLVIIGFLAWQWHLQRIELWEMRRLIHRALEHRALERRAREEQEPEQHEPDEPREDSSAEFALQLQRLQQELMAQHDQVLQLMEEVRTAETVASNRLQELRSQLQDAPNLAKSLQRFQKETTTGLERLQVTQAGFASSLEALKASEKRDLTLLQGLANQVDVLSQRVHELTSPDTSADPTVVSPQDAGQRVGALAGMLERMLTSLQDHTRSLNHQDRRLNDMQAMLHKLQGLTEDTIQQSDALTAQLGELQADVGLVLKARPVRGAGRSRSPYDPELAEEYYHKLQKLIRVMIKNDKASSYALEGIQYLHESLHVQASLTQLLASTEFAIRVSPQSLEASVLKPLLDHLDQALLGQRTPDVSDFGGESTTPRREALQLPQSAASMDESRTENGKTLQDLNSPGHRRSRWDETDALRVLASPSDPEDDALIEDALREGTPEALQDDPALPSPDMP
ncbi:MAG: hypothetical protein ACKO6N_14095 [Myxococcota bacterium]